MPRKLILLFHLFSQIDDFSQEWTFAEGSVDFVHLRFLVGCVTDWTALLKQAYKTLKPGGWVETFDFNGYFESDDGTLTNSMALAQWGIIFRKGAEKLGSTASFTVVRDKLQRKALEASGFVNIQEKALKVGLRLFICSAPLSCPFLKT